MFMYFIGKSTATKVNPSEAFPMKHKFERMHFVKDGNYKFDQTDIEIDQN